MNWHEHIRGRFTRLGKSVDETVVEELAQHAADACEAAQAEGIDAADAEAASIALIESWCRDTSGPRRIARAPLAESSPPVTAPLLARMWLETVWSLKRAVRVHVRAPLAAVAIVGLTSLGIAGIAALFGPLYSLVLSPLRLPEPDQLVRVGGQFSQVFNVYTNTFYARERFQPVFSHMAVYAPAAPGHWRTPASDRPITPRALGVTPELFETLGVAPQLGRSFADEAVNSQVVVLSDRLWRTQFNEAPDIIGTTVGSLTIVGVMPEGFDFPHGVDAWIPLGAAPRSGLEMDIVGRMRPGLSLAQASADLEAMGLRPGLNLPGIAPGVTGGGPLVQSLQTYLRGDTRGTLWTLWAVSGAFLLLACVGVANLLLAQGVRRRAEVRVHLALGASRWRVMRQFLVETLVLVAAGAVAGLWLSVVAGQWLVNRLAAVPAGQPFMPATIALVVGLVAVVTLACGLVPALHATRGRFIGSFATRVEGPARSRRFLSLREGLAAAQLALALALLVGAGLLARSVAARMDTPLGFTPDDVVTFGTTLPSSPAYRAAVAAFNEQYGAPPASNSSAALRARSEALRRATEQQTRAEYARNRLFVRELVARLEALPVVASVGGISAPPFTAVGALAARVYGNRVSGQSGAQSTPTGESINVGTEWVSPNGFDVLGIARLTGRWFTEDDVANEFAAREGSTATTQVLSGPVVIINEGLARRLWPGEEAVGKYISTAGGVEYLVVGMVSDFQWTAGVPADRPAVYFPFAGERADANFVVKLHEGASAESFAAEVDRIVSAFGYDMPRVVVEPLETLVIAGQRDLRLALKLLGWFAALGIVVAALGVYTAVALLAASMTREVGIRMALGASPAAIRTLLLSRVSRLLVALPAGWVLGWGMAKPLSHLLFQVPPVDPMTYASSAAAVVFATAAASVAPLVSAGRTDPVKVLRDG